MNSNAGTSTRDIARMMLHTVPVVLPLLILIASNLRGLDYGFHWDEKDYQIKPIKNMVATETLLPGVYLYPSVDYWIGAAALLPDIIAASPDKATSGRQKRLLKVIESDPYLIRLRAIFAVLTALSVLWIYLLVLIWRRSSVEALAAASFLALSWEVAYHSRWIATDGILMQFGALTILFTIVSRIRPGGRRWVRLAAVAAGLGCGTKYPGRLLLVPVLVGGCLLWDTKWPRRLAILSLVELSMIFAAMYLISTPGTVLQPLTFRQDLSSNMTLYSSGHAGYTVSPGLEHGARIFAYLSLVSFSRYMPIALLFFTFCVIGGYSLVREDLKTAILFFCFPVLYLPYFSLQKVMIVRNLLVIAPFMAILAARGTVSVSRYLKREFRVSNRAGGLKFRLLHAGFVTVVVTLLAVNATWLIYASRTIVERNTDYFIRQAASYISAERGQRFFLSERVARELALLGPVPFTNVVDDATKADQIVFYKSEGMEHPEDWPANRRTLTKTWFGPYEVNINMYPTWEGDDRIIVMSSAQAKKFGLLFVKVDGKGPVN